MLRVALSGGDPTAMGSLLSELGLVVAKVLAWVTESVNVIVSHPFLLLTTGVLMLGAAIGIIGRLLSRN